MTGNHAGPSPWARRLGFGGLVPFAGLATALWTTRPDLWPMATLALLAYGAVIASFLGAIHWGLVMRLMRDGPSQASTSLVWGVAPGLLGWVAVLWGHAQGLVLIAIVLWLCFAVDRTVYPRHQLQSWLPMRLQLTLVASLSCLAAAVALLR